MRRSGILLITVALVAGMVGCVSAEYDVPAPDAEGSEATSSGYDASAPRPQGSEVTSVGEETFDYVEWTLPDLNFGATLTGPVSNETGSISPADLQRHNFFSGAT